jgi:Transposase IS66 family
MSDVTERPAYNLMKSLGVEISVGTISNLLKEETGWALEEQEAILCAGLRNSIPKQMDTTANRQKGQNKTTHIITNANFTAFYTTDTRTRLDCLRALQGNPKEGILLLWYEGIETALIEAKLKASHPETLKNVMKNMPCLTIPEFDALMEEKAPEIFKRKFVMRAIREEMALAYYKKQQKFLPLKLLLSDNAAEYQKIAQHHALCWVHDARHYNMLSPRMAWHLTKLEDFKKRYWEFYRKLLDYTRKKAKEQQNLKTKLLNEFDALFVPDTQYEALDKIIEGTLATKRKLLLVLDFPDIPLHNNAAELAARRVVRKRDISLHTWSDWGTQLRDAFLSIIQTALKLKVSPYQFICDRISGRLQMDSLATIIDRIPLVTRTF